MTASLTPPPPRPVPAEVRHRVASRVWRDIAAETKPKGRRAITPWALAALVLVIVLGVAGVLERSLPRTPPSEPAPPPGWSPPRPHVTGLSEEDSSRIVSECTGDAAPPGKTPLNRTDVALYNVFSDAYGSVAFVFGSEIALTCDARPGDPTYRSGGGFSRPPEAMLTWMTRPVTIDLISGGPTGTNAHPGPWAETFAGRVANEATRVSFRAFGRSIELPVMNGTYVGRMVFMEPADTPADYEVTAYDAAGKVIATTTSAATCAVTPDGFVINSQIGGDCPAAVPWG